MPRRRTTTRRRERIDYGEGHRLHLLRGCAFGLWTGDFGDGESFNREAAVEGWNTLRDELLAEHIAEHPCTRPWAWWHLEKRELRRRLDGGLHPCEDPSRKPPSPHLDDGSGRIRHYYGVPSAFSEPDDWEAEYESQAAYLTRLELLTKAEKRHLDENPELLEPASDRGF